VAACEQYQVCGGDDAGEIDEQLELRRSGTPSSMGSTGAVRCRPWICGFRQR
jgi:hypothetical protein